MTIVNPDNSPHAEEFHTPPQHGHVSESIDLHGHHPEFFSGQRGEVLQLLRAGRREGRKIPSFELAGRSLQYNARILELRRAGFDIRNETRRVGGKIHGLFELVSEPGEHKQPSLPLSIDATESPLNPPSKLGTNGGAR